MVLAIVVSTVVKSSNQLQCSCKLACIYLPYANLQICIYIYIINCTSYAGLHKLQSVGVRHPIVRIIYATLSCVIRALYFICAWHAVCSAGAATRPRGPLDRQSSRVQHYRALTYSPGSVAAANTFPFRWERDPKGLGGSFQSFSSSRERGSSRAAVKKIFTKGFNVRTRAFDHPTWRCHVAIGSQNVSSSGTRQCSAAAASQLSMTNSRFREMFVQREGRCRSRIKRPLLGVPWKRFSVLSTIKQNC